MSDPKNVPARYADEANVEPTARSQEVVPEPVLTENDGTEWFVAAPDDAQEVKLLLVLGRQTGRMRADLAMEAIAQTIRRYR